MAATTATDYWNDSSSVEELTRQWDADGNREILDLAMRVRQLLPQPLGLLAVLAHFGFDLPDVLVDLMAVVAAHHRRELARRGLFEEVGQLGVNVRLHVA